MYFAALKLQDMRLIFLLAILYIGVNAYAQCGYYYMQNNKTITMGSFDKSGKENGRFVYKVLDVSNSGGVVTSKIKSEAFDKKGKSIVAMQGNMQCKNGVLMLDMKTLVTSSQMQQFKDADVDGKISYLEYPGDIKVGQTLPDGKFDMDVTMQKGMRAKLSMEVTNRKVLDKERVTTKAGSWDAYKISYNAKMVITMGISIPVNVDMTEWFVPGFGMVKSSSKSGTQELLSIE